MVFSKNGDVVRIQPFGNKFLVSAKRMYVNDSPELVLILTMLLRRGFREVTVREVQRQRQAVQPHYAAVQG